MWKGLFNNAMKHFAFTPQSNNNLHSVHAATFGQNILYLTKEALNCN